MTPALTTRLNAEQIAFFHTEGDLMVPDLFAPEELEPLRQEIAGIIEATAQRLQAEGKIAETFAEAPFESRLHRLVRAYPDRWHDFRRAIEGKAGGGHTGREMFNLLTHPRLLDVLEGLIGPEIIASSVYRIRPKLPGLDRGEVPWHQDSGYFSPHCDRSLIVTCWIPLVDATIENGCLLVLPRTHRVGIVPHHTGGHAGYLEVKAEDLPAPESEAVYVPVPLGGALLMTNMTPHCSRTNATDLIRWSVDLRYQSREVPTNAFQEPEAFDPDAPEIEIACYAPEGDFVVRSRRNPESIHTYEQYVARRNAYDAARLPYPQRGWTPLQGD